MARTNAVNVNQHRHRGTGNAVEERRERDEGDSLLLAPRREGFRCVASPLHTESPVRKRLFQNAQCLCICPRCVFGLPHPRHKLCRQRGYSTTEKTTEEFPVSLFSTPRSGCKYSLPVRDKSNVCIYTCDYAKHLLCVFSCTVSPASGTMVDASW